MLHTEDAAIPWYFEVGVCVCVCVCVGGGGGGGGGAFYWHALTLIPVWISTHLPSNVWG